MGHTAHLRIISTRNHICAKIWLIQNIDREKNLNINNILFVNWNDFLIPKSWVPLTPGCFVAMLVEIVPVVLQKMIFKFRLSIFISPCKETWPFSWIKLKLNSPHSWMHCAKFGWNWPSGFEEENFLKSRQCTFAISFSSALG